jgi:glyoxylase-like metal-dependent hydrolase (beta-lactamase superfamily II)
MWRQLSLALAIVCFLTFPAGAQSGSQLQRVADLIGVSEIKTIQFSGNGTMFALGQSATPIAPWPRYYVKTFSRTIDYNTSSMRDDYVRLQGENPPRGGGGQPIAGEQRVIQVVSGDHAWNEAGKETLPRFWEAADRAHQIWITPQGVIRAALANNATVSTQNKDGRKLTVISFLEKGKQKVNAYVNEEDQIERVESWYGHPVVGDMMVDTRYGPYRDFAGNKFPSGVTQMQDGYPALDLQITAVRANLPVDIQVPDNVRNNPTTVKSEKAADGLWYITGGSHHSAAIEMKDHIIVVEGPQGDQRSVAVIAEVKKIIPNKPIKYLVNTHHHFDHSGGVRAFAAEGATIITHAINQPYYERAAANSRNFSPDRLAKSGKKPVFQAMGDNMVLTDGSRTVELYQIGGNTHHDGLIMAYLRKEKILIEADAYTPGPPDAPVPASPNPFSVNLVANVRRLGIDVERILPLHGRIVPYSELQRVATPPKAAEKSK